MLVALLRHGKTSWNLEKRYQGRTDIELLPESIEQLRTMNVSQSFVGWKVHVSPLKRAQQTAACYGFVDTHVAQPLIECDFGEWEGKVAPEILRENPDMPDYASLDFRPPEEKVEMK